MGVGCLKKQISIFNNIKVLVNFLIRYIRLIWLYNLFYAL